jgi:hypothetical protein
MDVPNNAGQLTKRMRKTLLYADIRKICSSLIDLIASNDLSIRRHGVGSDWI